VADISPPIPLDSIVVNDVMLQEFMLWTQDITDRVNFNTVLDGTGTPEAAVSALANKFFRDTAVPNLYWKSVDDVAGDDTLGWLLVV